MCIYIYIYICLIPSSPPSGALNNAASVLLEVWDGGGREQESGQEATQKPTALRLPRVIRTLVFRMRARADVKHEHHLH